MEVIAYISITSVTGWYGLDVPLSICLALSSGLAIQFVTRLAVIATNLVKKVSGY